MPWLGRTSVDVRPEWDDLYPAIRGEQSATDLSTPSARGSVRAERGPSGPRDGDGQATGPRGEAG